MAIEPGEFAWGAAMREDWRDDRERNELERRLAAGWRPDTAAAARDLHERIAQALARPARRPGAAPCNETAMGLVGESHGAALAEWWARARGLDDDTVALLRECAAAAASMAMVEGYHYGRVCADAGDRPAAPPVPAVSAPIVTAAPVDGAVSRELVSVR